MKAPTLFFFILLSCSIFTACQEEVAPEKPNLNREELLFYLAEMPEFQNYSQEAQKEVLEIYLKKKELSQKEFDLIASLHQKYPDLAALRAAADDELYETYKSLTTIDLLEESSASQLAFEAFLLQLKIEVDYETKDLLNAMFQLEAYSLEETEKTLRGCIDPCIITAMQIQASHLTQCLDAQLETEQSLSSCRIEARHEFEYSLRGCFSNCDPQE